MDEPVLFGVAGAPEVEPDRERLGGKGAGLVAMTQLGLPVPPGFILDTAVGARVASGALSLSAGDMDTILASVARLEKATGRSFGSGPRPLLVSVRSGAPASMPGMMDTVLNVGLTREASEALAAETGDRRFALDCRRRFLQAFSQIVLDLPAEPFEEILEIARDEAGVDADAELDASVLKQVVRGFEELIVRRVGDGFPDDAPRQLQLALLAVFNSWNADRAAHFRQLQGIGEDLGTAAVVQVMVFGNRSAGSATGVMTTRNPSTGEAAPFGEYMANAQGDDIVGGLLTPAPLTERARHDLGVSEPSLERVLPDVWEALRDHGQRLEAHYGVPQEIEFTVEDGQLMLLQVRAAKLTDRARLRVAVEMAQEGAITRAQAVERCGDELLAPMLVRRADPKPGDRLFAKGLPASPGAASGVLAFTSEDAVRATRAGQPVVLLRRETDPSDVHGMDAAVAIVTARGGMTSHAAVVARGMGRPCVTAASGIRIDAANGLASAGGQVLRAGDRVTVDGASGQVFIGTVALREPAPTGHLATILEWKAAHPTHA